MKRIYKNGLFATSGALLCIMLAAPASAQRPGDAGRPAASNNGGSRPSAPAPSSGGGSSVSSPRPSFQPSAGSRPSPVGMAPQRQSFQPQGNSGSVPTYSPRPGNGVGYGPRQAVAPNAYAPRQNGGVGYGPRQGVTSYGGTPRQNGVGFAPRPATGNYGYAPRQGFVPRGATGYRTSPPVGYGGYWGNRNYNYHNHGYYNSYYYPRLGFTCSVLPYGYYNFYWGDYQYFYSDGLYYQYENDQYTVVEPPIGAEVASLPEKAESIVINGQQYYELNGVYYQPVTKDDGTLVYMIAGKDGELNTSNNIQDEQPQGPQMGDIVTQLPPDCRKLKVNGEVLYVSPDGVYYQQEVDPKGNKTYKVVGLPSDEPDQN